MAIVSVALFALGGAFSVAAATPNAHSDAGAALHHDHAGHHHHAGDSSGDDLATVADQAPGGDGPCDHPNHSCFHVHACCMVAMVASDVREPQPPTAGSRMSRSFDVLPAGRITHPLLRPPRTAA